MKLIADNKKALFDFEVLEDFETGIRLNGREVKSLRTQKPNIRGAFVGFHNSNLWLKNLHIPRYKPDGSGEYDPVRDRQLLLHKKEIEQIAVKLKETGTTVVPLSLYFKGNLIKLKIAVVRGRKKHDKREVMKKKDQKRQMQNVMKQWGR